MSVVGFDFGYQTCYIAVARQGGIETVANEYSDRCTPTYVSMGERSRAMGASAKSQLISNNKNTIWGFKKLIGRPYSDPQVQNEAHVLPYDVVEGPNGTTGIRVHYLGDRQTFTPKQVTAMMLTKLKETAGIALKTKVVDCVISVPCYYTDIERRAMLDAAHMAGLNVLRLMNDTTATALAYGIYKQDLPAPDDKPRNIIFCDMGHSDLQLAAVAFNKGKLKVLATASETNLGGRDFDALLAGYFAEDFKKRYRVDAKSKPRAFSRLLQECEKLKKLMSANVTDIPINIECFMEDKDVSGRMSRATMEEMAEGLLQRAEATMASLLQHANLKTDDVTAVEIIGGATRMPCIKAIVKTIFNKEPSTTLNADESVARGCALQCAILSPTFRVRDFSILDVQPYPITLCWQSALEGEDSNLEVFSIFHQVPFSKMLTFYRKEQFVLDAKYSPNSHIPFPASPIGAFKVDKVIPQANGESTKVKVKVRVNIHGIFNVESASMVEKLPDAKDEEAMDVENGPIEEGGDTTKNDKDAKASAPMEEDTEQKEEQKEAKETNPEQGETPMQTDGEQPAEGDKASEKKEETKKGEKKETPSKKKKNTVKVIDLPVTPHVPQLNAKDLNLFVEKEGQMIMQDKLEKERADSKNAVEEYVYEMRDKLSSELESFVKEQDRDKLSLKLEDTENWLYDEGEDQKKQVYLDKLADLKKLGQPIIDRHREFQDRPQAFDELGQTLQLVSKAIEAYKAQDEKYSHIEAADMEKVEKCWKEKTTWFEKQFNAINSMTKYDNPPILVSQVYQTKDSLILTCNPILTKPKPKPKEEPPKDDKKTNGEDKKNGASTEQPTAEQASQPSESQPADDAQPKVTAAEMDLD